MSKILENLIITNGGYVGRPLIVRPSKKSFLGGNVVGSSVLDVSTQMLVGSSDIIPSFGGTMTIDNKPLGNYEFVKKEGNQVISSFNASNWFEGAGNEDGRSAWIIVNGDMTIDLGQTLTPPGRRLFTVIYVKGDLTVNGEISMTARGANHSATGSNVPAQDILLATGTYSLITNPIIPATGGAGAIGPTTTNTNGVIGTAGTLGGSGGGGSGSHQFEGRGGNGSNGTAFSGGTGGGAVRRGSDAIRNGKIDGGEGGTAQITGNTSGISGLAVGGGAGNPGGVGAIFNSGTGFPGDTGTAGTLIIFSKTITGSGGITSNGSKGGDASITGTGTGALGGGGSGGGSVNIITQSSTITPMSNGGSGGVGLLAPTRRDGGAGGAGTARILQW
jgi:hypothetical protein